MGTKILYLADPDGHPHLRRGGCGATVRFDTGEPCTLSIARIGILVKKSRLGFGGAVLYDEKNVYKAGNTAMALTYLFPEKRFPDGISNPVLRGFFNAILHCSSCAEVARTLNEAVSLAEEKWGCELRDMPVSDMPSWATPDMG